MKAETDYWLQAHQFNAHHSFIHSISHNEHKIAYFAQHKPFEILKMKRHEEEADDSKKYNFFYDHYVV